MGTQDDPGRAPDGAPPAPARLHEALHRHHDRLMAIDGVEGCMIGVGPGGAPAIIVLLRDASVRARVPKDIEGHLVVHQVSGSIDAL